MDFFEKAHVVKRESSRKEHKSDEVVKRQLKQMLQGYKQSDSKLIKSCEDACDRNKLLDESSSVSGFSDLNLTNSSNEGDARQHTAGSDSEDCENSNEEELISSNDNNSSKSLDLSNESISEYNEKIDTLSDNISPEVSLDSNFENVSDIVTLDSSFEDSTTENDLDESEFDQDGTLANKILEKLKDRGVINKRGKKRKNDGNITINVDLIRKQKMVEEVQSEDSDVSDVISQQPDDKSITEEENTIIDDSHDDSSDFVSIAATNMPVQTLNEVLGEYKHPTFKNVPETQNIHTPDIGAFTVEDLNVQDIQITNYDFQPNDNIENIDPKHYETNITVPFAMNQSSDQLYIEPPLTESETSVNYDTLQFEDTSEKELSVSSLDSTFISPVKVYFGESGCVFVMKHPAEFYIHGKVIGAALWGNVEIFGHVLNSEPCEIFAPNYSHALSFKTLEGENVFDGTLFSMLTFAGLSVAMAEEIVTELGEHDGIVSLKKLSSKKMDFVESMVIADLFSKTSRNVDICFKRASEVLGCSLYITRPYKIYEHFSCSEAVAELGFVERSRGIICGGKGVGKSTFLRYCVNRLVARGPVVVFDLDPGQAEFTVAGNISATIVTKPLLGPNFTHLVEPKITLNIGMINTMDNPTRYITAVGTLFNFCSDQIDVISLPWIVNTMGMCNCMGLKFMTKIILQVNPTYVVQIDPKHPKKRFDRYLKDVEITRIYNKDYQYDYLFDDIKNKTHNLNYKLIAENREDSSPKTSSSLAPRDERYLNFLAYFGKLMISAPKNGLLGVKPYAVNLRDVYIGFNTRIAVDAVPKVINGKIIALCNMKLNDTQRKVFTLENPGLDCYGHGLIRGIDFEKGILYIITPLHGKDLVYVNTILYADWVPELRGLEKHLPDGINIPYRTATMYQRRELMFAPRRRFNPLQLLKMTRNS